MGFNPAQNQGAGIEWIKHGVWITSHDFHPSRDPAWVETLGLHTYPGLMAVVEADALRMDFFRQGIIWDDAYRDVLAQLQDARDRAARQICGWVNDGFAASVSHLPQWSHQLLKRVTAKMDPDSLATETPDAPGYQVARARIWLTTTGHKVSLHRIRQEVLENGTVGFTFLDIGDAGDPELIPNALSGGRLVLRLRNEEEEALWQQLLGSQLQIVTNTLQRRWEAVRNHRRFRSRQVTVGLPTGPHYLAETRLKGPGLSGTMGLRADRRPSRLSVVLDRCLLVQLECAESLLGLEIVISGDFTPNDSFTDVRRDVTFGAAMGAVLASLDPLYARCADPGLVTTPIRRRQILTYLLATLTPGFAGRHLAAWGAEGLVP